MLLPRGGIQAAGGPGGGRGRAVLVTNWSFLDSGKPESVKNRFLGTDHK